MALGLSVLILKVFIINRVRTTHNLIFDQSDQIVDSSALDDLKSFQHDSVSVYFTDFSSTATGASILFLFVSVMCPFMIISSSIM